MPIKFGTRFCGTITSLLAGSDSAADAAGRWMCWLSTLHSVSRMRMDSRITMPASSAFKLSRCSLRSGSCGAVRTGVSGFMVRVSSAVYSLEERA